MNKTYIIAEAGVNHNGDLEIAKKLVQAASACGADAIKFQTFSAEKLVTQNAAKAEYQKQTTDDGAAQYKMLKSLELLNEHHFILKNFCAEYGLDFLSSSFHLEATEFLADQLKMDVVKFGSGELTNAPLLWDAACRGLNIWISTGMANIQEIYTALNFIAQGYDQPRKKPEKRDDDFFKTIVNVAKKVSVFHCTSCYPTAFEDVHLNCLKTLMDHLGEIKIGFSDHTTGIEAPIAAVAMGAQLIEKHFTLDTTMTGPDHKASLDPQNFKSMVTSIRNIEKSMGSFEKKMRAAEENTSLVARKHIVACKAIKAGELLNSENITLKRTGHAEGLNGFEYWNVLGTKAVKNFSEEEIIVL